MLKREDVQQQAAMQPLTHDEESETVRAAVYSTVGRKRGEYMHWVAEIYMYDYTTLVMKF